MLQVRTVAGDNEYQDALAIRRRVFMDEQHVPEELEIDEYEGTATHFVAYHHDEAVGAGRYRLQDGQCKVERICVLASWRKYGVGEAIMKKIEQSARERHLPALILDAQTHAESFYERLGYIKTSEDIFLDAGIPHVAMKKSL